MSEPPSVRARVPRDDDPFTLPMLSPKTAAVLFAPTGTRNRREQDLSHLKDAKKPRASQIPPTMIPEQYHIKEESPTPPFDPAVAAASTFDEKKKVWRTTVFPSPMPTSRQEVMLLEQWLDARLLESQQQKLGPIEAVKRAQQLYSQSFHEILRQVYVTCTERGQLLDKIWSRYLELFDHVLKIRDKERVQYNQKLQQQKLMYQQLYKDKDDAFNQVYLQLAAEKERIQMARDKLERAVLLMQDDIRKRVKKEARLKRVVHHLRMRAKEMNVEEEMDEGGGYESDDSLLPPDLTADCFSESNVVVVNKLKYIEDKLQKVRASVPAEKAEANYGSLLELDSLLHSLADTISRLTSTDDTPALRMLQSRQGAGSRDAGAGAGAGADGEEGGEGEGDAEQGGAGISGVPASISRHSRGLPGKFRIDKAVQYLESDIPTVIPKPFSGLFSKSLKMMIPQEQDKSWALTHINALYMQKIMTDEESDAHEGPRSSMTEFMYGFFVSLYGVRCAAEQAFADFMASCQAHAEESLRVRMFLRFAAADPYTREDFAFFLYTLAQFFERREGDISFSEAADGTQWVSIDTARLCVDVILRDQDADVREAVLADCERCAAAAAATQPGLEGRLELDAFLEAMTSRAHAIGGGAEEQISGLYNAALAVDAVASPSGALIFDDVAALVRGFSSGVSEVQLHQIFRDLNDELGGDPPPPRSSQPSPASSAKDASSSSGAPAAAASASGKTLTADSQQQQMARSPSPAEPQPIPIGTPCAPPATVLPAVIKVLRAHGLLGWRVFPPTSVDRRQCGEYVFGLLQAMWGVVGPEVVKEAADLQAQAATSPDSARAALLLQERADELQRALEARDSHKAAISAMRALNEQLWFVRRRERKFVQGRTENGSK